MTIILLDFNTKYKISIHESTNGGNWVWGIWEFSVSSFFNLPYYIMKFS